jgi:hypothetical protein
MPRLVQSTFTRWSFTEDEFRSAQILSDFQIMAIQNLICDAAEEKLTLKFDPSNPLAFAQREAELQGQIGVLKLLIECSQVAQSEVLALARQQADS